MAWFKVDDTLHSHPKVREAGPAAIGVWTMAGAYAMAYKTDGFVPDGWLRTLGKSGATAARKLVDNGMWEKVEGGHVFHDWADYQPSASEIENERENARKRQRESRERRRQKRLEEMS